MIALLAVLVVEGRDLFGLEGDHVDRMALVVAHLAHPARVELARLTVRQYRHAVADLVGRGLVEGDRKIAALGLAAVDQAAEHRVAVDVVEPAADVAADLKMLLSN